MMDGRRPGRRTNGLAPPGHTHGTGSHAAQALNVWLTWLLYNISALIVGGLLALDSARVALTVVLPLAATLWLVTLAYLIRAARLASQGREYALPRWLCSRMIR